MRRAAWEGVSPREATMRSSCTLRGLVTTHTA